MSRSERLGLDALMFVGLVSEYLPAATGVPLHELLAVAVIPPLLLHIIVNWDWVVRSVARFAGSLTGRSRLDLMVGAGAVLLGGDGDGERVHGLEGAAAVARHRDERLGAVADGAWMSTMLRRTLSVLAVNELTAVAVYESVTGLGGSTGERIASGAESSLVCPRTGCTASSCHADGLGGGIGRGGHRGERLTLQ